MTDLDVDKIQEIANALASDDSQVSYGIAVANTMLHWKQEQMIERITKLLKENCGDDWYIIRYSDDDAVLDRNELLKDIIQIIKED